MSILILLIYSIFVSAAIQDDNRFCLSLDATKHNGTHVQDTSLQNISFTVPSGQNQPGNLTSSDCVIGECLTFAGGSGDQAEQHLNATDVWSNQKLNLSVGATGAFTFGGWFRTNATGFRRAFSMGFNSNGNLGVSFGQENSIAAQKDVGLRVSVDGTTWELGDDASDPDFPTGAWTFAVWVRNASSTDFSVYINNSATTLVKANQGTFTGNPFTSKRQSILIGTALDDGANGFIETWSGALDELFLYNRTLTNAEFEDAYINKRDCIYLTGQTPPVIPADRLNITSSSPSSNGTTFRRSVFNMNVTVTSSYNFNSTLYINGTANGTRIDNSLGVDSGVTNYTVNFTRSFPEGHYSFQINSTNNETSELTLPVTVIIDTIDVGDGLFPLNDTQYNTVTIDFNLTLNSTNNFNVTLYINGTANSSLSFSGGFDIFVNFTKDLAAPGQYNYSFVLSDNRSVNVSSLLNRVFYVDIEFPTLTTNLSTAIVLFNENLSVQFNLTDDFILFSYNISIDSLQRVFVNQLNVSNYIVNFTFNPVGLSIGTHNLTLRFADGHTAKDLRGDYKYSNGLLNHKLKFEFWDEGEISITPKSVFDRWKVDRKKDRYSFDYDPLLSSTEYTFTVESDKDVYIVNTNSQYKNYLIVGEHWLDFVSNENPTSTVNIQRVNNKTVSVSVAGLKKTDKVTFNSIGDLNVVERNYTFQITNITHRFSSQVNELEQQAIQLDVNYTSNMTFVNATLYYNFSLRPVTFTNLTPIYRFSSTFITPEIPQQDVDNVTRNITWLFDIRTATENTTGRIQDFQNVFRIGLDNCSTYGAYGVFAMNITVLDENLTTEVNSSVVAYMETWIDSINDFVTFNLSWNYISEEGNSSVDNSPVHICLFPNTSIYYSYLQFQYEAPLNPIYKKKLYFFDNTTLNNVTKKLNLYLTANTQQVKFTVVDFNDKPVENALIQILSYDIGTNTGTVTEVIKTDSSGEAFAQTILDTKFYKFIIIKDEKILLSTKETKITSLSNTFRVDLAEDYFTRYTQNKGVSSLLTFANSSLTFTHEFNDADNEISEGCLRIVRKSLTRETTLNDSCVSGFSGTINIGIVEDVDDNSYMGIAYVKYTDGEEFVMDSVHASFLNRFKTFGLSGIFITAFLIIALVMIGIWNPSVSVVLGMLALFSMQVLNIIFINWGALVALMVVGGIVIYRLNR